MVIDIGLTRYQHVAYIKMKLTGFIYLAEFISGTKLGTRMSALLRLQQAVFMGCLSYSIPAIR